MSSTTIQTSLCTAASSFLAESPMRLMIGGRSEAALRGATLENLDPGTGAPVCLAASGGAEDADRAVSAARKAFHSSGWASVPPAQRAAALNRLADLAQEHLRALAELECLDVGKPLSQGLSDVKHFIQTVRFYAQAAARLPESEDLDAAGFGTEQRFQPWGVSAVVLPWNYPLVLFGWNVIPALAAGNTVVVKPAEQAFLTPLFLTSLASQCLPEGVLNILTGTGREAGAHLVRHPDVRRVSFTGSAQVGREIAAACGRNLVPVKLELGGKGAAVVCADANLEEAASALVRALTTNTGQVCFTATRWVVQRSVIEQFLDKAASRLAAIRIGYWADSKSRMGPLISAEQRRRVLEYQQRALAEGAEARLAGGIAEVDGYGGGFYVKPALLAGAPGNVAEREEIFGPVAYATAFEDEEEAAQIVNASAYGLANSVWTGDTARARRMAGALESGTCWLNCQNVILPGVPFAGVKGSGMGGGILGQGTLRDYMRAQSVIGAARGRE